MTDPEPEGPTCPHCGGYDGVHGDFCLSNPVPALDDVPPFGTPPESAPDPIPLDEDGATGDFFLGDDDDGA
jgi:hypothetical protein